MFGPVWLWPIEAEERVSKIPSNKAAERIPGVVSLVSQVTVATGSRLTSTQLSDVACVLRTFVVMQIYKVVILEIAG